MGVEMRPFPRRIYMDKRHPAETACGDAIEAIERLHADERLTRAQTLISEAQALVGDVVDEMVRDGKWSPPEGQE